MDWDNKQHSPLSKGFGTRASSTEHQKGQCRSWAPEEFLSLIVLEFHRLWASLGQWIRFCSVAQLCLTLCNPMDCSMPGFPVLHHLLGFLKLISLELVMPPNRLILCCPFSSCPPSFSASESFPMSRLFVSGGQCIGALASAAALPVNIQG